MKFSVLQLLITSTSLIAYADNSLAEKKFSMELFFLNGSGVSGKVKIKIKKIKHLRYQLKRMV